MQDVHVHTPAAPRRRPAFLVMTAVLVVLLVAVALVVAVQFRSLSAHGATDAAGVVRQVDAQLVQADEALSAAGTLVEKGVDAAASSSSASSASSSSSSSSTTTSSSSSSTSSGTSSTSTSSAVTSLSQLSDASRSLSEAFTIFAENKGYLAAQAGDELTGAVETAIAKRQEMLECAQAVLAASSTAQGIRADAKTVFDEMKTAATAMADSATTTSNSSSEAALAQALVYDKAAKEGFARAKAAMESCASKLSAKSSGVTSLENYLSKQMDAADALMQSDEALLRSDADAAAQHLNSYQAAADQASALEKSAPASAEELVKNVYYSLGDSGLSVMDAESRYAEAEAAAKTADEKMDAFLS